SVAREQPRARGRENQVRRAVDLEASIDSKGRLGVSMRQHRSAAPIGEPQLQAGTPADSLGRPLVTHDGRHLRYLKLGTRRSKREPASGDCIAAHASSNSRSLRIQDTTSSRPDPLLRLVNTNGRSPRIVLESRAITSRLAPTYGARSILLITSK